MARRDELSKTKTTKEVTLTKTSKNARDVFNELILKVENTN